MINFIIQTLEEAWWNDKKLRGEEEQIVVDWITLHYKRIGLR